MRHASCDFRARSLCLPNEDVGKRNRRSGVSFRGTLRGCEYSILATNARKITRKDTPDLRFRFPTSSFGRHKIVHLRRILMHLDNKWGLFMCSQHRHLRFSCSFRQRAKVMRPKRRFGKTKQSVGRVFSSDFANIRSQNRVLRPSQSHSKRHAQSAVKFSKIFVWGSRRQLTPVFDKPAFSRFSQKLWTTNRGLNIWENSEKGRFVKSGGELSTAGLGSIKVRLFVRHNVRIRSVCDAHLAICLVKSYKKTNIAHRPRIESVDVRIPNLRLGNIKLIYSMKVRTLAVTFWLASCNSCSRTLFAGTPTEEWLKMGDITKAPT